MKFHGQWNPPVDEVLFQNYFSDDRRGFWIECGAAGGGAGSNCLFFEEERGWTGINIEASPSKFSILAKSRTLPTSLNLNLALSSEDGTSTFTDVLSTDGRGDENGSLRHSDLHVHELNSYGCKFSNFTVRTVTYATLVKEFSVRAVDLLSLDVEGFEVEVLKGMNVPRDLLPKVLCIEYPYVGVEPLKSVAESLGYEFDFLSYNNAFFSFPSANKKTKWIGKTGAMSWVDERWVIPSLEIQ